MPLEAPQKYFLKKKIHENDRNEILGKVAKFQVVISTNEGTAQENPQGGPIRPPRTGIGLRNSLEKFEEKWGALGSIIE